MKKKHSYSNLVKKAKSKFVLNSVLSKSKKKKNIDKMAKEASKTKTNQEQLEQ